MNDFFIEDSISENDEKKATASFLDLGRMWQPIGGFDMQEVIDEYKKVNLVHLQTMERIDKIILNNEVTDEDSDYFEELDLSFSKMELDRKSINLNGEEITESILHATLIETYNKSKIFFGNNDVYQWKVKEKEYKAFFIKLGQHVQLMISTVGRLYTFQTDIFKAFDTNYKKYNSFSEVCDFDALLYEAEKISDLTQRRLLILNMYVGARKLYLHMTEDRKTESLQTEYENFIKKCEEYLELIDFQIDNASKSNSMEVQQPLVSALIPSSTFKLAPKKKTDFIKVISAMYDAKIFVGEDGKAAANKQELMVAFGNLLNDDFSKYSSSLAQAKSGSETLYMKTFETLSEKAMDYLNAV